MSLCNSYVVILVSPSYPLGPPDWPILATNVASILVTSKVSCEKGHAGGTGQDRAGQLLAAVLPNWRVV